MTDTGRGYYVKGSDRGSIPGRVVVLVTPSAAEDHTGRTVAAVRAGFRPSALAHCQRSGPGYSSPVLTRCPSPASVWEWLENPRLTGRKTYVFSPVASDSLTLLGMWDRLETDGVRWAGKSSPGPNPPENPPAPHKFIVRKWALNGSPDILDYTVCGKSFRWLSCRNFYREPERVVAAAIGYKWTSVSDYDDSDGVLSADPADRALMWHSAITQLMLWWRDRKAGRFPLTLAGMGYAFLRSRFGTDRPCTHTHDDIIRLERRCCHGGRATLWYVGDVRPSGRHTKPAELPYPSGGDACISGPIHHVDIASMYPSIMRREKFPVKYYMQESNVPIDRLREMLAIYHVCARVRIDTTVAEYPCRRDNRVLYPTGQFTTHLTSPELLDALNHGAITNVYHAALYHRGKPFVRAANELLKLRAEAKAAGRDDWAKFVKGITNAATGKLAQRKYQWVPCPGVYASEMYGSWPDLDTRTGKITVYMSKCGLVWERSEEEGGVGTLTASYAHLTAYGRQMMRRIRETLPPRSVLSQDTDGIWITDAAYSQLCRDSSLIGESAGLLRLQSTVTSARFWTAQHYTAGGSWTLSGFCDTVKLDSGASFSDHQTLNPIRSCPLRAPSELIGVTSVKTLDSIACDGVYADDGWMTPYRLPGGVPTKHQPPPPPAELF